MFWLLVLALISVAQADIKSRLASAGIRALFPGDATYPTYAASFNSRFSYKPAAIAYPTSADQVAAAVIAGRAESLPVVARSGGSACYEPDRPL